MARGAGPSRITVPVCWLLVACAGLGSCSATSFSRTHFSAADTASPLELHAGDGQVGGTRGTRSLLAIEQLRLGQAQTTIASSSTTPAARPAVTPAGAAPPRPAATPVPAARGPTAAAPIAARPTTTAPVATAKPTTVTTRPAVTAAPRAAPPAVVPAPVLTPQGPCAKPATQLDALLCVKSSVDLDNELPWSRSTGSGTGYCSWKGIRCDNKFNVVQLNLGTSNLRGTMPAASALKALPELLDVKLNNNTISGTLPADYATLANSKVRFIDVSSNKLNGSLPAGELCAAELRAAIACWIALA